MKDMDIYVEYCSFTAAQVNERNAGRSLEDEINSLRKFDKSKLPSPVDVLRMLNIKEGQINKNGYWTFCCPFHKYADEMHPSFNMHHQRGNYRCHTCAVKGGNILKFYCEKTGKSFQEAAKDLGAWRDE